MNAIQGLAVSRLCPEQVKRQRAGGLGEEREPRDSNGAGEGTYAFNSPGRGRVKQDCC